jgi:hypothetical protein
MAERVKFDGLVFLFDRTLKKKKPTISAAAVNGYSALLVSR